MNFYEDNGHFTQTWYILRKIEYILKSLTLFKSNYTVDIVGGRHSNRTT